MIGNRRRRPKRLKADKGYDDDNFRREVRKRRIIPCIPERQDLRKNEPQRGRPPKKEDRYCRQRWKVERTFSWINNNRRIDRFMEKKQKVYAAFMEVAIMRHYLNLLY